MHHINAAYEKVHTPTSYVTPLDQRVWLGSKPINQVQVNIRWMTMPAASDGILETLINCGCKSGCSTTSYEVGCSARRCACQKADLKCTGLCSCCECTNFPDRNTDENNLSGDNNDGGLLFELDGDDTGFDGIFEEQ
jgi:hypothetical protein